MPERNIEFRKFGASGIKEFDAVARRHDQHRIPVTAKRGWTGQPQLPDDIGQDLAARQVQAGAGVTSPAGKVLPGTRASSTRASVCRPDGRTAVPIPWALGGVRSRRCSGGFHVPGVLEDRIQGNQCIPERNLPGHFVPCSRTQCLPWRFHRRSCWSTWPRQDPLPRDSPSRARRSA